MSPLLTSFPALYPTHLSSSFCIPSQPHYQGREQPLFLFWECFPRTCKTINFICLYFVFVCYLAFPCSPLFLHLLSYPVDTQRMSTESGEAPADCNDGAREGDSASAKVRRILNILWMIFKYLLLLTFLLSRPDQICAQAAFPSTKTYQVTLPRKK